MKYQFCIRFTNTTTNSAATKAIIDCNRIFSKNEYEDYTFTVTDNASRTKYYVSLLKELITFLSHIKNNSIVGIQYPLLSINNVFKYFIRISAIKKTKFFCIIHDLESLRTGGKNPELIKKEIDNLNQYQCVIAHNPKMINWLQDKGLTSKTISLNVFDYLCERLSDEEEAFEKEIVFAGNLNKSTFIYALTDIKNWQFNVYGPNFTGKKDIKKDNVEWRGEYSPEVLVTKLKGSFGLIWDGNDITECDEILGNYLKFNNPHKFSLYLASGLPVIAPAGSAIGEFITQHRIGLLVNDLRELENIQISLIDYNIMKANVLPIQKKIISGFYFQTAVQAAELLLS